MFFIEELNLEVVNLIVAAIYYPFQAFHAIRQHTSPVSIKTVSFGHWFGIGMCRRGYIELVLVISYLAWSQSFCVFALILALSPGRTASQISVLLLLLSLRIVICLGGDSPKSGTKKDTTKPELFSCLATASYVAA